MAVIVTCYGLLRLSEIETLLFEDISFEDAAVFIKIQKDLLVIVGGEPRLLSYLKQTFR